jgi:hypothetical protein
MRSPKTNEKISKSARRHLRPTAAKRISTHRASARKSTERPVNNHTNAPDPAASTAKKRIRLIGSRQLLEMAAND